MRSIVIPYKATRLKTVCSLVPLALAILASVVFIVSRDGKYRLYTSPLVTVHGEQARFKVLIPAGWQPVSKPDHPDNEFLLLAKPAPGRRLLFLPPWLDRYFHADYSPESDACITVSEGTSGGGGEVGQYTLEYTDAGDTTNVYVAYRDIREGMTIRYCRSRKAGFDATFRQVCESFEVVR